MGLASGRKGAGGSEKVAEAAEVANTFDKFLFFFLFLSFFLLIYISWFRSIFDAFGRFRQKLAEIALFW